MKDIEKNILLQAFDQLPVGAFIIDAEMTGWPIRYMNPIMGQLTGLDVATLVDRPWAEMLADPAELEGQRERLQGNPGLAVKHLRQRWQSRSGVPLDLLLQVAPLYRRPGQPSFWLVTADVEQPADDVSSDQTLRTALSDAQAQLRRIDHSDPVTGLPNRQAFLDVLERDWAVAGRDKRRISLIVFRVEDLAAYREVFGRQATEASLRKLARAISAALRRRGDVAARVADDRFAALVGSGEPAQVHEFAEIIAARVRDLAIHHPRSATGRFLSVSFSVGSEMPRWGEVDASLLQRTEAALDLPVALPQAVTSRMTPSPG